MGTSFILISGPRGHGKDHLAKEVEKNFPLDKAVRRLSLADPIKEIAAKMLGTTVEYIESRKRDPESGVRGLLIDIGLAGRRYLEGLWVNRLIAESTGVIGGSTTIVPDVRFWNEVEQFDLAKLMGCTTKVFVYDLDNPYIERECESEKLSSELFDHAVRTIPKRKPEYPVHYDKTTGYFFVDNTGRPDLSKAGEVIANISVRRHAERVVDLGEEFWLWN